MEDLFNVPILEELYDSRCENFETYIMKKSNDSQMKLSKITDNFEEVLKIIPTEKKKMINDLLEKSYKDMLDFSTYWGKQYYKLGILDGKRLKTELKENKKIIEYDESFINDYSSDFDDFFERYKRKELRKDGRYREILSKISKLKDKNPNILNYLENNEIKEFTKDEIEALLEIINLNEERVAMEIKGVFRLGIREANL